MPIDTKCPTCEKPYLLADNQAGKRVRCKHCDDNFLVPGASTADVDEDDDRPARKSSSRDRDDRKDRDDRDDKDERRSRRRTPRSNESGFPWVIVAILGGVGLLAILGIIGVGIWIYSSVQKTTAQIPALAGFNPNDVFANPANVDQAVACLSSQHGGQRKKGAEFLARQKVDSGRQKQVARALEKLKDDPDPFGVKEAALNALAVWGDADSATVFLQLMNSRDDGTRTKAREWLRTRGTNPVLMNNQSLADLRSADGWVQAHAADYFSTTPVDPGLQAHVARGLEAPALNQDRGIRERGVKALLVWATRDSAPTLIAIMESDRNNRDRILQMLAGWKDVRALTYAVNLFSGSATDRRIATRALEVYGAMAEPQVLPLLQHGNSSVRRDAAFLLGKIGTRAAVPHLEQAREKDRFNAGQYQFAINQIQGRG